MVALTVEVVDARPHVQSVVVVNVTAGTSLREVVRLSGFPLPVSLRLGVFGKLRDPAETVRDGDRIEIYRELLADPKQRRRQRAAITS